MGRIRMKRIPDTSRKTLHGFIAEMVEPGSTIRTDGLQSYRDLAGYVHERQIQSRQEVGEHLLPRVHQVISLLKRWLLGTHQGGIGHAHLDYYLDEFTFRFNRRNSKSRGKLFYRLLQQAVQVDPVTYTQMIGGKSMKIPHFNWRQLDTQIGDCLASAFDVSQLPGEFSVEMTNVFAFQFLQCVPQRGTDDRPVFALVPFCNLKTRQTGI